MDEIKMYFGLGGERNVSVSEFDDFVAAAVTTRFQDGLMVLDGTGQWMDKSGQIIYEPCKILVLIVESWQNVGIQNKVYDIRNEYCNKYNQESVLVAVSGLHEVSF